MTGGLGMLGVAAATLVVLAAAGGHGNADTGAGFLAVIGLGMFGIGALRLPGWARRRKTQIDQVLARLRGGRA
jgi:hypothetical protein